MDFSTQFLFFFSSLGVFNGFLMSLYFLFLTKPKRIHHRFFGLLLLMLSIRIGKSVLYHFDHTLSQSILQVGLSACVFIGPLLYFYVQRTLYPENPKPKQERLHLLTLLGLIVGIGLIFPYSQRPDLWNPEIVQGIYAIWLAYVIASGWLIRGLLIPLFARSKELSMRNVWLLTVFGTNAVICLVFHSILYLGFPSYIFGPLSFSMVFYALMAVLIFSSKSRSIIEGKQERYVKKKINGEQADRIRSQLYRLMEQERIYEDPSLKLKDLAGALSISPHLLSQVLNDNLNQSFSDLVNSYRIQAASDLLQSPHPFTIEGIGTEVGFRSKSTFYTAFKKHQGMTPAQFAKRAKTV